MKGQRCLFEWDHFESFPGRISTLTSTLKPGSRTQTDFCSLEDQTNCPHSVFWYTLYSCLCCGACKKNTHRDRAVLFTTLIPCLFLPLPPSQPSQCVSCPEMNNVDTLIVFMNRAIPRMRFPLRIGATGLSPGPSPLICILPPSPQKEAMTKEALQ